MKTNLVKKIISISVISLVLALVVLTIVLALVPKKFENPIADNYATITIYKDGVPPQQFNYTENPATESEKAHNEIMSTIEKLHEESLKDNLLSAIFQGTGSFEVKVVKEYIPNVITTVAKAEGTNALVYTYLQEEKQVLKINGEVYKDESKLSSTEVTFDMIVMPLGTTDGFEQRTVYLANRSNNQSSYQVTFIAHQAELNDYISSLDFGVIA